MMSKDIVLKDCDADRAALLVKELGKVRCWLTGWREGRSFPGQNIIQGPPGEDAIRQVEILLKNSIGK